MTDLKVKFIDTLEKVNDSQWNNLVEQSELGGFFHTYEWLKVLEEELNWNPIHIIVEKNLNPIGLLPNFVEEIEKSPFNKLTSIDLGFGGPVISSNEEKCLNLMIDKAEEICRENILVSHRLKTGDNKYVRFADYLTKKGYEPDLRSCSFRIALDEPYEELKNGFSKDKRYDLRKADPAVKIEDGKIDSSNIHVFYEIYRHVMTERLNTPPLPQSFFERIVDYLSDSTKLSLAKYGEKLVGGFIHFLDEKNSIVYHVFGSVPEKYLPLHVTDLLHEHSIKWSIKKGYDFYDLGGNPASFQHGLYKYKDQWGEVYPNPIWEKEFSTFTSRTYGFIRRIYGWVR